VINYHGVLHTINATPRICIYIRHQSRPRSQQIALNMGFQIAIGIFETAQISWTAELTRYSAVRPEVDNVSSNLFLSKHSSAGSFKPGGSFSQKLWRVNVHCYEPTSATERSEGVRRGKSCKTDNWPWNVNVRFLTFVLKKKPVARAPPFE